MKNYAVEKMELAPRDIVSRAEQSEIDAGRGVNGEDCINLDLRHLGEARIMEVATQARPTLADNLPHIRCSGPRSVQINGLYRHGFLIAPAVLDALMQWLHTGQHPMADNWGLRFDTAP